jgi:HEPN domain-containing protein
MALAKAHVELPGVLYEDLCFDAQQAAEKGIKAFLVHLQVEFPKTHAVSELLDLIEGAGLPLTADVREANRLTRYAVATRYVGLTEDVTEDEYRAAVNPAHRPRVLQTGHLTHLHPRAFGSRELFRPATQAHRWLECR